MTIIKIEGINIQTPTSRIKMYTHINDKIIVCLDENFPSKCLVSEDVELRRKYIGLA